MIQTTCLLKQLLQDTGTFTIQNDGALFKQNDNVILDVVVAICQVSEIGQGTITNFYINAAGKLSNR